MYIYIIGSYRCKRNGELAEPSARHAKMCADKLNPLLDGKTRILKAFGNEPRSSMLEFYKNTPAISSALDTTLREIDGHPDSEGYTEWYEWDIAGILNELGKCKTAVIFTHRDDAYSFAIKLAGRSIKPGIVNQTYFTDVYQTRLPHYCNYCIYRIKIDRRKKKTEISCFDYTKKRPIN